jgi:hypothetical protein
MRNRFVLCFALALFWGCSDSTGTGTSAPPPAHIRVVNSVFQGATPATASPITIDYLIDGSTASPGVANLAGNTVSAGGTNNFQDISVGIHSFVARIAGKSSTTDSLYTTTTNLPWVPRQYLTANSYYTVVVSGVIPATGNINNNAVAFSALVDDPFPPIKINGTYQARFRVINAAPYAAASGNGSLINVFITPGATPPATLTTLTALATAGYRNTSTYLNVDAGTYTLTVSVIGSNIILSQSTVTFAAGEVRTFIIQSNGPAPAPGVANHRLTSILDQSY